MNEQSNLKTLAYAFIRDAITSGEFADGSRHSIYGIADELGISRTPVREAVLQLAEAGLVSIERNRGFRIHGTTAQKVRNIFELRLLLEVPAAFHAANICTESLAAELEAINTAMSGALAKGDEILYQQHDRDFHDRIACTSGNEELSGLLDGLREVILHPKPHYGVRDPRVIIDEHRMITGAIALHEPVAAAGHMRTHLVQTGDALLHQLWAAAGQPEDPQWARRMFMPMPMEEV